MADQYLLGKETAGWAKMQQLERKGEFGFGLRAFLSGDGCGRVA